LYGRNVTHGRVRLFSERVTTDLFFVVIRKTHPVG
jgi:hypothetical protein